MEAAPIRTINTPIAVAHIQILTKFDDFIRGRNLDLLGHDGVIHLKCFMDALGLAAKATLHDEQAKFQLWANATDFSVRTKGGGMHITPPQAIYCMRVAEAVGGFYQAETRPTEKDKQAKAAEQCVAEAITVMEKVFSVIPIVGKKELNETKKTLRSMPIKCFSLFEKIRNKQELNDDDVEVLRFYLLNALPSILVVTMYEGFDLLAVAQSASIQPTLATWFKSFAIPMFALLAEQAGCFGMEKTPISPQAKTEENAGHA